MQEIKDPNTIIHEYEASISIPSYWKDVIAHNELVKKINRFWCGETPVPEEWKKANPEEYKTLCKAHDIIHSGTPCTLLVQIRADGHKLVSMPERYETAGSYDYYGNYTKFIWPKNE